MKISIEADSYEASANRYRKIEMFVENPQISEDDIKLIATPKTISSIYELDEVLKEYDEDDIVDYVISEISSKTLLESMDDEDIYQYIRKKGLDNLL